jgi:hypothetical protein
MLVLIIFRVVRASAAAILVGVRHDWRPLPPAERISTWGLHGFSIASVLADGRRPPDNGGWR